MRTKVKILKGDLIPSDKIKTGDVREFQDKIAKGLIEKGIAEVYKPRARKTTKKAE